VHRTPRHIYAQLFDAARAKVLAAPRPCRRTSRGPEGTGNIEAAKRRRPRIAERAKAAGITRVAFDRAGFQYHGRVKALAEAAREAGLEF
jgi:large subunit ribosomal protein L18